MTTMSMRERRETVREIRAQFQKLIDLAKDDMNA